MATPGEVIENPSAAILLAAGESTRMGRPKALLLWRDTTLLAYQVRELRAAGIDNVVVVVNSELGFEAPSTLQPSEAMFVTNMNYQFGRASSLRWGARSLGVDPDPIVVLNVDQPRPASITRALLEAHTSAGAMITIPTFEGRRGHPVVVAGALHKQLRIAKDKTKGLRGIIARHEASVLEVEIDDEQVVLDINTPEEYAAALRRYGTSV